MTRVGVSAVAICICVSILACPGCHRQHAQGVAHFAPNAAGVKPMTAVVEREQLTETQVLSSSAGIEFSISQYKEGVMDHLIGTVRNTSNEKLWLVRPTFTQVGAQPARRDVWIEVRDTAGNEVSSPLSCKSPDRLPSKSKYAMLAPGETISVHVFWCAGFEGPGPWTIVAHYQDIGRQIPVPPDGAKWFAGSLRSNALVVGPDSRDVAVSHTPTGTSRPDPTNSPH